MNKILKSEVVAVEIKSAGAEMISFKRFADGREYIWNGDKKYWARHSPVLFPIVCNVNHGEIRIDGETYPIENHGFAKTSEFDLVEASESHAVYRLSFTQDTLKAFPFRFAFYITYTLKANTLSINYRVDNVDDKSMYFQIGTHTGFNCPINQGESIEDYFIEFSEKETLERYFLNSQNLLINGKSETLVQRDNVLALNHEMFYSGGLIFKNIKSKKATLRSRKSDSSVILTFHNLPNMAIWQAKDAPFICIEPWHGMADTDDFNGDFRTKEMIIELHKGESFACDYEIEVR